MAVPQKTLDALLRQLRRIQEHRQADAEKKIARAYKKCRTELRGWLGNYYADHAQPDGSLTYADVQAAGGKARFLEELKRHSEYVSDLVEKEIGSLVEETYNACYDGMIKAVKSASDASQLRRAFEGLSGCTPHQIKAAVENPIHGIKLPERLNHNRRATLDRIRRDVAVGLQNGDRYTTMAKRISDDLDMDYRKAVRVARTEAHRVREQGFNDSSDDIQDKLVGSGYVMTKTWRTMQDESVRPQLTKKGKPKGTANHRVMQDVTVLQDEDFDLGNGVFAPCPGSSGDAGNDINCRCRVSRKLMKVEDYEQLTGKSVPEKYRKRAETADNSENEVDNSGESGIIRARGDSDYYVAYPESFSPKNEYEGSSRLSSDLRARLSSFEDEVRDNDVETAIIITSRGEIMRKSTGAENSVEFSYFEMREMKGGVLSHNHANGTTFSSNDISMLFYTGLSEIRACNSDGAYVMRLPQFPRPRYRSKQEIEDILRSFEKKYSEDRARGPFRPLKERDYESQQYAVEQFAKLFHCDYYFERRQ